MNQQRPLWAWLFFPQLAVMICASVLVTTGHFPVTLIQRSPFDKVGHLLFYGGLSFLGVGLFGRARRWPFVIGLLVIATLEELSQRAFPRRTFDLGDLAMNLIGIAVFGAAAAATLAARGRRARLTGPE
jgi:VanZ family protein